MSDDEYNECHADIARAIDEGFEMLIAERHLGDGRLTSDDAMEKAADKALRLRAKIRDMRRVNGGW